MTSIMHSMVRNKTEDIVMEEKIYKTMNGAGVAAIVIGVISIVVGVVSGILLLVSGAKLIARKSNIIF